MMLVANRDAVVVNKTGMEVSLGGTATLIEDATKYF